MHHLPRVGGTLIAKCIGSLPNTVLLSEINPDANIEVASELEPIFQASFWYRLFSYQQAEEILNSEKDFVTKIALIHKRAEKRGESLVIRDWSYINYFAKPYRECPDFVLGLANALKNDFEIRQVLTVRHPLDQWLSWESFEGRPIDIELKEFMRACRKFAELSIELPFIRYEDFVDRKKREVRRMCEFLDMKFDPVFAKRWKSFRTVTGDVTGTRGTDVISKLGRRDFEEGLASELQQNEDYQQTLQLLGYT